MTQTMYAHVNKRIKKKWKACFIYLFIYSFFFYSYVHTMFGSFLPIILFFKARDKDSTSINDGEIDAITCWEE
jgi:hypothetical protein